MRKHTFPQDLNIARLEVAFQYVKKHFFPRWDKKNNWVVSLDGSLPGIGRCNDEENKIMIQFLHENDDELYRLLIHEICHTGRSLHNNKWLNRMLEKADIAEKKGFLNLSNLIKKEVKLYQELQRVTAGVYSAKIGHLFRSKAAGCSDLNRPPCRSEATLVF